MNFTNNKHFKSIHCSGLQINKYIQTNNLYNANLCSSQAIRLKMLHITTFVILVCNMHQMVCDISAFYLRPRLHPKSHIRKSTYSRVHNYFTTAKRVPSIQYECNLDVRHSPCCHHHVTHQRFINPLCSLIG